MYLAGEVETGLGQTVGRHGRFDGPVAEGQQAARLETELVAQLPVGRRQRDARIQRLLVGHRRRCRRRRRRRRRGLCVQRRPADLRMGKKNR